MNFKNFENHLDFVSVPACRKPDRVPLGVRLQKFSATKVIPSDIRNCCSVTIYRILRHDYSYILPSLTIGMRKQFQCDHNIPLQGINRYNNARLPFYSYKSLHAWNVACVLDVARGNIMLQLRSILGYNA